MNSTFSSLATKVALGAASMAVVSAFLPSAANAQVIRIGAGDFTPQAGQITFSEFPIGTNNPFYTPAVYGGIPGVAPDVSFGAFFFGQSLGNAASCPPGAALTGCVIGTPTGPLALVAPPNTFITSDGANPTSPVLSGTPLFNGSIAILFSKDLAGVGLDGGFFDAIGGTAIKAYARNGNLIGSIANESLGIEFLGLATEDGSELIAGLEFSLVGPEPAGFAIDNLRFGQAGQIVIPPSEPIPTPALLPGLIGMGVAALRKRNQEEGDSAEA